MRSSGARAAESIATAAAGGGLALLAGMPIGLPVPFAAVGAANGALSGWRGVYRWARLDGWVALVLDSTWAVATTAAALVSHAVTALRRNGRFVADLSERSNRHVYEGGFAPRRGFAVTLGNTISGLGDTRDVRRRRLVTDHEDVHVWQARWFGPLYPGLYVGWAVAGGTIGAVRWLARRRQPLGKMIETHAYYLNPFEWWAYSRDGEWPPHGMLRDHGWRRPVVRSFVARRGAG